MSIYSRALKHIDMKDVKKKHQQKLIEQKIQRKIEREEKKYIQSVMESKRYDWRKKINEQMTTSDVFFTNLPATGDVNLQYPILVSGGSNNGSISNNTITIGGNPAPYSTNGIILNFDSSLYDTLKFNINNPSGNLLGFFIGNSSSPSLIINSSGTYTLIVPQSKNLSVLLDTPDTTTISLSGFSFQRRTPLNVFVSLDSPEASAFIRTDPMMSKLSPQERLQKLKEMLEASDEYVMKIFGGEFPGTGAAAPGEYDPFAQAPPGEAGDTPGVEIASHDKPFSKYPPAGGPDGWPGLPQDKMDILHPSKDPLLNIPITPFGLPKNWQAGQEKDTQVAQLYPADYDRERAVDQMLLKGLQRGDYGTGPNIDRQIKNLQKNLQQRTPGGLPQASTNQKYQVANYEPQGEVISERRKLKSPQEILNRIPGYYDGKPAPLGFPETPPPQMVNGMHPDLVDGKKVADRFNRLDPQSAKATPLTGNPHIDKKVLKARKQPK